MPTWKRPLPMPRTPGQRDPKLPKDELWKFLCQAMTLILLLLAIILVVSLARVLKVTIKLQDELNQLNNEFEQGLADARHHRDSIRGEMFRLMEAVWTGNGRRPYVKSGTCGELLNVKYLDAAGTSCRTCSLEWMEFEGSCYYFSTESHSWSYAMKFCNKQGAHLVSINSLSEQKFLNSKQDEDFWIDFQREYPVDSYKWPDVFPLTYTYWNPKQSALKYWICTDNFYCYYPLYWICEKPQIC